MRTHYINCIRRNGHQIRYIALALLLVVSTISFGQVKTKVAKIASEKYSTLNLVDAYESYEKAYEKGDTSFTTLQRLGDIQYARGNYKKALKWYQKLVAQYKIEDTKLLLRYAQVLASDGQQEKAKEVYNAFLGRSTTRPATLENADDYENIILPEAPRRYQMRLAPLNTEASEYGGSIIGDQLVFASNKDTSNNIDKWSGTPYFDLWEAKYEGYHTTTKKFDENINTKAHESTAVFSADGNTMYFTSSDRKSRQNAHLRIYRSKRKKNGQWSAPEDLSINGEDFSTAHPSLSADGKTLYFTSDRPGGYGATDIYRVALYDDGSMESIENLGPTINTLGRESFPFSYQNNELYFSSDGHFGLGGYDVYYTDLNQGTPELLNLGIPINSTSDDFAFFIDASSKKGGVSSNRSGGKGKDDIYLFEEVISPKAGMVTQISGILLDVDTNEPIGNAKITVKDADGKVVDEVITGADGSYVLKANKYQDLTIAVSRLGYKDHTERLDHEKPGPELYMKNVLKMKDNAKELEKLTNDVQSVIKEDLELQPIYFDLGKSTIRPESFSTLRHIVQLLTEFAHLKIDIGAHTDSRSNDVFNLKLSRERADNVISFLVTNGIEKKRISGTGYGEHLLINRCSNGVECSEDEHQLNRRVEFKVSQ